MGYRLLTCSYCTKRFLRNAGHVTEIFKLQRKPYCSIKCLGLSHRTQIEVVCSNNRCGKRFYKIPSRKSVSNYCSRNCAASVNNSKFPRRAALRKECKVCFTLTKGSNIYCSRSCRNKGLSISKDTILTEIKQFYRINQRIPLKSEFPRAFSARKQFGTWNQAILSAGYLPNPVKFTIHYKASDGHNCDSLSEKIIDDWIARKKLLHIRNVRYPGRCNFTVDFVVNGIWIEYFGLSGQLRRYDEIKEQKLNILRKYHFNAILIYPDDLFPKNKLNEVLGGFI